MRRVIQLLMITGIIITCMAGCKKQQKQVVLETVETTEVTEVTIATENAGFEGEELQEPEEEETKAVEEISDNVETLPKETEDTKPGETFPGNGIPYHSGDDDLLEPPANSSTGEL